MSGPKDVNEAFAQAGRQMQEAVVKACANYMLAASKGDKYLKWWQAVGRYEEDLERAKLDMERPKIS